MVIPSYNVKNMFRIFLQEIYVVEDLWYYNTTVYRNYGQDGTLNVNLPNTPFILEYDSTPTSRNNSTPYLDIGRSSNDRILIGQYARAGTNGIITYTGSQTNHPLPSNSVLNQVNHYTFTYDGSDYVIDRDGESLTVTGVGIHLDKIIHVENGNGGSLTNIKVKAL